MISLKYITSLAFSQLCGAGGGCKKTPLYISLQANIIGEKKTKQNEFCCALWSMSVLNAIGLAVVCVVIFRSGYTITTF